MSQLLGDASLAQLQIFSDEFWREIPRPLQDLDQEQGSNPWRFAGLGPHENHKPYSDASKQYDGVSCYSGGGYWLVRKEWYRVPVNVDFSEGTTEQEEVIKFHGTEWGAAFKIVVMSEGFIVGQGTHRVNNASWTGVWCTSWLADAVMRAHPERQNLGFRGDYTRFNCPVALELSGACFSRVKQTEKFCARAPIGSKHTGIHIRAIHFNTRWMRNYLKLEVEDVRRSLREDPFRCRRCACGLCGAACTPDDEGEWNSWQKSQSRMYYTEKCKRFVTGEHAWV